MDYGSTQEIYDPLDTYLSTVLHNMILNYNMQI